MATSTLEERVAILEQKIETLAPTSPKPAWWKKLVGVYKGDPEFTEAERLGREYRESLRPKEDQAA